MWVLKVKVISWPWPKVIYIWKLKLAFLRNDWAILNQILFCAWPKYRVSVSQDHWSSGFRFCFCHVTQWSLYFIFVNFKYHMEIFSKIRVMTWNLEIHRHHLHFRNDLSRDVRKPDLCICENKDADQLRGDREADQRLCFRHLDSTIPLLSNSEISCL